LLSLVWGPLIALVAAHIWGRLYFARDPDDSLLANSPRNVSRLALPDSHWRFAVIGDLGKRYEILTRALVEMKQNDARLVWITGDLVYRKTAEQYRYLRHKVAQSGFDRPIFAAIGNEDMNQRGDYALFRRYLSASPGDGGAAAQSFFAFAPGYAERFAFVAPAKPPYQALFIALDNAFDVPTDEQLDWVEQVLRQFRRRVSHIFLFAHQPVVRVSKRLQRVRSRNDLMSSEQWVEPETKSGARMKARGLIGIDPEAPGIPKLLLEALEEKSAPDRFPAPFLKNYRRLYKILGEYRVSAIFSGHLHGYGRYSVGNTLHFITGGGGARLHYPEARYHYLEVEVRGDKFSVRPKILPGDIGMTAKVEQIVIGEIYFFWQNRPWLYGVALLWLAGGLGLLAAVREKEKSSNEAT
jgi:hypothetical protein